METSGSEKARLLALKGSLLISVVLFIYVVLRAWKLNITHDEAVSFIIIKFKRGLFSTSNNQWGNTLPEMLLTAIFGYSVFILRLANILSFIIYLFFIHKIYVKYCRSWMAILLSVPFLLLNPFLLEFFALSRGYGMAVAFFTGSIYWALRYTDVKISTRPLLYSILFAVISIYCNYAFVTAIFSLHFCVFGYYLWQKKLSLKQALKLGAIEFILLLPAFANILYLKSMGELYYGGTRNIIQDTLYSLTLNSIYEGAPQKFLYAVIIAFFVPAILFLFVKKNNKQLLWLMIFFSLLIIPTLLFHTMQLGYPLDRTALYWIVVFGILILFFADAVIAIKRIYIKAVSITLIAALSCLSIINFAREANLTHTRLWIEDQKIMAILEYIGKDRSTERVRLGTTWYYYPAINYYQQNKLPWLDSIYCYDTNRIYDYYLAPPDDTIHIPIKNKIVYRRYPEVDAILYKNGDTQKN